MSIPPLWTQSMSCLHFTWLTILLPAVTLVIPVFLKCLHYKTFPQWSGGICLQFFSLLVVFQTLVRSNSFETFYEICGVVTMSDCFGWHIPPFGSLLFTIHDNSTPCSICCHWQQFLLCSLLQLLFEVEEGKTIPIQIKHSKIEYKKNTITLNYCIRC